MSVSTRYTCDGCGAEKKEVNHWFAMRQMDREPFLRVGSLSDVVIGWKHYCGQNCAMKAISAFLDSLSGVTK